MSKIFKTQKECFDHVCSGKSIYLEDKDADTLGTEIKFIDGVLRAYLYGEWVYCPINFENPNLFKAYND